MKILDYSNRYHTITILLQIFYYFKGFIQLGVFIRFFILIAYFNFYVRFKPGIRNGNSFWGKPFCNCNF